MRPGDSTIMGRSRAQGVERVDRGRFERLWPAAGPAHDAVMARGEQEGGRSILLPVEFPRASGQWLPQ